MSHRQASGGLQRLVIRPNASLAPRSAIAFVASTCLLCLGIAGLLAWRGFWMVLPFAVLEMTALAAALWWSMRDNAYREVVSVGRDRVRVQAGRYRPERHWEFQRAWTQVRVEPGAYRTSPSRLWIGSHGRGCVFGYCLTDDEREQVAGRLRQWLEESPPARIRNSREE